MSVAQNNTRTPSGGHGTRAIQCGTRRLARLVLAGACLVAAAPAAPQSPPPGDPPVFLKPKQATRLLVKQVVPEYPATAKVNYIQGKVRMKVTVTADGRVIEAHVEKGHPFLAASALKAVRAWIYRPLLTKLGAAGFMTVVDVNFALRVRHPEGFPRQAEADLSRQVRPPQVLIRPGSTAGKETVRLHVLVNAEGHAIDSEMIEGARPFCQAAQEDVTKWVFRPARWGTMAVPWYLDVDVPVVAPPITGSRAARGVS